MERANYHDLREDRSTSDEVWSEPPEQPYAVSWLVSHITQCPAPLFLVADRTDGAVIVAASAGVRCLARVGRRLSEHDSELGPIYQALSSGTSPHQTEVQIDGAQFQAHISIVNCVDDPADMWVVTLVPRSSAELERDVGRRHAMELNQKFVRALAHDLREPVRAIRAFGPLLVLKANTGHWKNACEIAKRMQAAADRLDRLIQELRSFALEGAGASATVAEWPLEEVVTAAIAQLRADEDNFLVTYGPGTRDVPVSSSVVRLLANLLDNAAKYTCSESDGVVATVKASVLDDAILLTVTDKGMGFPPSAARSIFEPFQQLLPHRARAADGVGIGLAICREIAERLGGRIWAHSEGPGHGATFFVRLPSRAVHDVGVAG